MFGFFKKNSKVIKSICDGKIIGIENLEDEAFSSKSMGDGFGIRLYSNRILAPVSGEIKAFFETKHAFMIESNDGLEILIHVGFDTVSLEGKGFTALKKQGDKVEIGEAILEIDREYIQSKGFSTDTAVIVANIEKFAFQDKLEDGTEVSSESIIIKYK